MDGDKDDIEKFIAVHGVTKASPAKARGAESQSEWALRRKGFRIRLATGYRGKKKGPKRPKR